MKVLISVLALATIAAGASLSPNQQIPILSQVQDVGVDGTYKSSFETGNGISVQEQGVLKNAGNKDSEAEEVQGSFQYTADDGTPIALSYIANENGFQPYGQHLPQPPVDTNTPPPTPPQILRALEWIKTHPYVEPQPGKKY